MSNVPPAKSAKAVLLVPAKQDEDDVRAAMEEVRRHPERLHELTPEELRRWAETGEWPESLG